MLLGQGDYTGALDALDLLHSTLEENPLAWLQSFQHLPHRMHALSEVWPAHSVLDLQLQSASLMMSSTVLGM